MSMNVTEVIRKTIIEDTSAVVTLSHEHDIVFLLAVNNCGILCSQIFFFNFTNPRY